MDEKTLCIIMLIFVCIWILIYLLWQIKKQGLKAITVELIVYAEKRFLHGQNKEKLGLVIDALIQLLPKIVQIFITREVVEDFVEKTFQEIKIALDYKE